MSTSWQSAYSSLDGSLARLSESMAKLKAAKAVDVAGFVEQLAMAAESAQNLRSVVSSAMPEASWQTREELDTLLAQIQKITEARARLSALATELERGSIVHRRVLRVNHVNQLREEAIKEVRSQAEAAGEPPNLPGPEADQWIEWACGLQEPDDAESLQALRNWFANLDNFVANLEPGMWVVKMESAV
jgi:hypothetical protein